MAAAATGSCVGGGGEGEKGRDRDGSLPLDRKLRLRVALERRKEIHWNVDRT